MDPIDAWKNLTNTERREVLRYLSHREESATDRTPWQRARETLQAVIDTPSVARND